MIRAILLFILAVLVYQALKVVFRAALGTPPRKQERRKVQGAEMVLDPECRTYVVKDRAVVRGSGADRTYFCSEECAARHAARTHR